MYTILKKLPHDTSCNSFPILILMLFVSTHEVFQFAHGNFQLLNTRQVYNTEMIWFFPVKTAAWYDKNSFLLQEIKRPFFIIVNIEHLCINLRKCIERSFWFYTGNTRNII